MVRLGDGAYVLGPGEARMIEVGGFDVAVHADGESTDGAFSLIETTEAEVGAGPPLHIHRDCAESFYVLEGAYRMLIGGRAFHCDMGSFVYVPRGVLHTFQSLRAGSRKLNLYAPAGMVGYFDELAAALRTGVDESVLDEIAGRYSMEVVGVVPEEYLGSRPARD
jgi:mannose-6-phosphate isomerase-like protein (cupin superfamily)